jgi:two-component system sensor histidine kinase YesM
VILSERENILDVVRAAAPERSLIVSVIAGDEVIAESYEKVPDRLKTLSTKQVGLTPFAVQVAVDERRVNTSVRLFTLAAVVTVLIFVLLLLIFMRLLHRRFFTPMLSVIGHVKTLGDSGEKRRLPPVFDAEFDALISGINDMLDRLERGGERLRIAEAKLKNNEIQKQKAIIFSLKKQINAHFTINTLSTVQTLANMGEVNAASQILSKLSSLIRYAYAESEYISVWEELKIIGDYIDVMNIRHNAKSEERFSLLMRSPLKREDSRNNNNIALVFDVDDRLMDYCMPRMLLQPIIENAITHGFRNRTANCTVEVRAQLSDGTIVISVADNGEGITEEALMSLKGRIDADAIDTPDGIGGIALVNIRRQLRSFYGEAASIHIESTKEQGTIVTLQFPAKLSALP